MTSKKVTQPQQHPQPQHQLPLQNHHQPHQQQQPYLQHNTHCAAMEHRPTSLLTALSSNRCLLQSQSQPHSQSITALPSLDLYGSSATLPLTATTTPTAAICGAARTPICRRHYDDSRWYPPPPPQQQLQGIDCGCCNLNVDPSAACLWHGRNAYQQQQQTYLPRNTLHPALHDHYNKSYGNGCYFGYDHGNHLTDEEDSAFPALADREFHMLHRNIPALRRTGVDTTSIRQYFYPDGGWGWIICGVSFLVHILTTGLQLSYGLLLFYAIQHLHKNSTGIEWLGALSWSISMLVSPFVVTFCRKKSTRLLAVVGGLVLPLGILFTSFATELGQIVFSYGIVFGVGVSMVRESSTIMLGNYFKRRRQFVEMVAMSGEGVGIALFSVILKEGVGKAGWRLGLQIIAALVAISFFMGLLYRPASLYHPQRRAIQHLKNQRKKMRENKHTTLTMDQNTTKYFFLDISPLKSATVRVLLMIAAVAALGIYTPMFTMSLNAIKEGSDIQDLVLLQTFLGMSTALGVVIAGALIRRPLRIRKLVITTQVVSQVFISTVAVAILFLSFVMGYRGLCILSWIYGIGLGGFRYSLKILALERIKLKQFSKAWGLIRGIESVPVLISVPLTTFLNDYSLKYGRAGYYICSAAAAIAGIIIFFVSYSNVQHNGAGRNKHGNGTATGHGNGVLPALRLPESSRYCHAKPSFGGIHPPVDYLYNGCDYPAPDLLNRSCISLNQVESDYPLHRDAHYNRQRLHRMHQLPYDVFEPGGRGGNVDDLRNSVESELTRQTYHYNFGGGSIGARTGKRLQRSLSFIQSPYGGYESQQWPCNCHGSYHQSHRDLRSAQFTQPILCTCSPSSYLQNSRSRSVPEGLSSISTQPVCSCRPTAAPSREIIYLPRDFSTYDRSHGSHNHGHNYGHSHPQSQQQSHVHPYQHHSSKQALAQARQMPATTPRYQPRQLRSQSLSKPQHIVEQITTSV